MITDAAMHEQDAIIWDLRVKGMSLRAIGAEVGLSHTGVAKALERGYKRVVYPKVEEERLLDLARLDRLLTALEGRLGEGDEKVISAYVRVLDRKAKMLGLDVPVKVDATVTQVTQQDLELQEILREQQAKNALARQELDQAP